MYSLKRLYCLIGDLFIIESHIWAVFREEPPAPLPKSAESHFPEKENAD